MTGISQLLFKGNARGDITFLHAKSTDDLLFAGSTTDLKKFVKQMKTRFYVSKDIIDRPILFNGFRIEQSTDGSITMGMA